MGAPKWGMGRSGPVVHGRPGLRPGGRRSERVRPCARPQHPEVRGVRLRLVEVAGHRRCRVSQSAPPRHTGLDLFTESWPGVQRVPRKWPGTKEIGTWYRPSPPRSSAPAVRRRPRTGTAGNNRRASEMVTPGNKRSCRRAVPARELRPPTADCAASDAAVSHLWAEASSPGKETPGSRHAPGGSPPGQQRSPRLTSWPHTGRPARAHHRLRPMPGHPAARTPIRRHGPAASGPAGSSVAAS